MSMSAPPCTRCGALSPNPATACAYCGQPLAQPAPPGYGAPPYGASQPAGYGAPGPYGQPGYGAPPAPYGGPQPGHGAPVVQPFGGAYHGHSIPQQNGFWGALNGIGNVIFWIRLGIVLFVFGLVGFASCINALGR